MYIVCTKQIPLYMRRNEFSRDTFYLFHQQSAQQMGEKKRKKSDKYVESVQRVLITQGEEIEKTGGKYQYKFVCVKNKNCHFHCARMCLLTKINMKTGGTIQKMSNLSMQHKYQLTLIADTLFSSHFASTGCCWGQSQYNSN